MLYTDFETRQQLALEHRDQLARDFRPARRTRTDEGKSLAVRRALGRIHNPIRFLTRLKPSHIHRPQEV